MPSLYKYCLPSLSFLAAFSFSQCALADETQTVVSPTQASLDVAKAKWDALHAVEYDYVYQRFCECLPDFTRPVVIQVREDGTVSGTFADVLGGKLPMDFTLPTIDDLFATIQIKIDEGAAEATIAYDADYGYPTNIFIDEDITVIDEETLSIQKDLAILKQNEPETGDPKNTDTDVLDLVVTQEDLMAARALWNALNVSDYDYEYEVVCQCTEDARRPKQVQVRDRVVFAANFADDSPDAVPTEALSDIQSVDALFDKIQLWINQNAFAINVSFDKTLGYPSSVFVDMEEGIADDEFTFSLKSLIAVNPTSSKDAGDGSMIQDGHLSQAQKSLDTARFIWEEKDISNYDYEYERECFCVPEESQPKLITVKDDKVASATFLDEEGGDVPESNDIILMTIDELFDSIQSAITEGAASVAIEYNETYGYPQSITIDPESGIADDETLIKVGTLYPQNGDNNNFDFSFSSSAYFQKVPVSFIICGFAMLQWILARFG